MIEIKHPPKEDIKRVLFDDEIYSRIADDTCPPKEEVIKIFPYKMFEWMGIYLNDEIIGIANIEEEGRFHYQVLKKYRRFSRVALEMLLKNINKMIYCEIPTCFRSVINFAKKSNFIEDGRAQGYFFRNGNYYDIIKLIYKK